MTKLSLSQTAENLSLVTADRQTTINTSVATTNTILTDASNAEQATIDAASSAETYNITAEEHKQRATLAKDITTSNATLADTYRVDAEAKAADAIVLADAVDANVVSAIDMSADEAKLKAIAAVYGQPSLELDFVNQRYTKQSTVAPWLRDDLDPAVDLTFTRATPKWVFDSSGTLVEVPVDQMAIDHDPVTGECLGVLIEPSATHDPSYLLPSNCSLTSFEQNAIGFPYSQKLFGVGGESEGVQYCRTSLFPYIGGEPYINHVVVRPMGSCRKIDITSASLSDGLLLDFDNKEYEQTRSDWETVFVKWIGDYAYVAVKGVITEGGDRRISIVPRDSEGNTFSQYVGDLVEIAHVTREMAEAPSSIVPSNNGSPVTRAGDNLTRAYGDELNPQNSTLIIDGEEKSVGSQLILENGLTAKVALYPRAMTEQEMQVLTTP